MAVGWNFRLLKGNNCSEKWKAQDDTMSGSFNFPWSERCCQYPFYESSVLGNIER